MRARTRLMLDATLLVAFIAAYRPVWTGVSVHQGLSIAIIVPLMIHGVVNWEWTKRVLRTFFERLLHISRLNLVIDGALFLSAVSVTLSGFMVSPTLMAPLGVHLSQPLLWHTIHVWSANATIAFLAIHGTAHWRWVRSVAMRPRGESLLGRKTRLVVAGRLVAQSHEGAHGAKLARGTSRVGVRAAQAKAERAMAVRAISVMGVTAAVGLTIFAGVDLASGVLPAPPTASSAVAKVGLMTCPATGCAATTCHAQYGKTAKVFYAAAAMRSKVAPKKASSAVRPASPRPAASQRHTAASSVAASKPVRRSTPTPADKPAPARLVCPRTGCTASSCHGTHHQSAATYYPTH